MKVQGLHFMAACRVPEQHAVIRGADAGAAAGSTLLLARSMSRVYSFGLEFMCLSTTQSSGGLTVHRLHLCSLLMLGTNPPSSCKKQLLTLEAA